MTSLIDFASELSKNPVLPQKTLQGEFFVKGEGSRLVAGSGSLFEATTFEHRNGCCLPRTGLCSQLPAKGREEFSHPASFPSVCAQPEFISHRISLRGQRGTRIRCKICPIIYPNATALVSTLSESQVPLWHKHVYLSSLPICAWTAPRR